MLIVLAKHETKAEGGQSFVSKQFEQRFSLPSGVKPERISSSLSKVCIHFPFDDDDDDDPAFVWGNFFLRLFWAHEH